MRFESDPVINHYDPRPPGVPRRRAIAGKVDPRSGGRGEADHDEAHDHEEESPRSAEVRR